MDSYPETIENTKKLDEFLSKPTSEVIETMKRIKGDIIFLGIAGKIGPSLARMAKRACDLGGIKKRIIGVSIFNSEHQKQELENDGIEVIEGDLLDRSFLSGLPSVKNVVYLVGLKFGSEDNLPLLWAINSYLPALIGERFKNSRIIAYSTGCVYPLVLVESGGSLETDRANPVGEYAQSCLGRERMFEYGSVKYGTKTLLIRLNYAVEMRYGVLVDIARKVKNNIPIDLTMGYFNVIWQGDANAQVLQSLEHCESPAKILNITGNDILSVKSIANRFAKLFNKKVVFSGLEANTALLSNAAKSHELFGKPLVDIDQMITWIADWISHDRELLDKPTHFEVRNGKY